MLVSRRGILRGLLAAPAIIAADRLMPIKPLPRVLTVSLSDYRPGMFDRELDATMPEAKQLINWIPYRVHLTDDGVVIKRADREEEEFHMARAGISYAPVGGSEPVSWRDMELTS